MHFLSSQCVVKNSRNLAWNWVGLACVLCALFFGLALLTTAQDATIVGTVTGPSGAAIPNVSITITNLETNLSTHFTTNDVGQYVATNLRIGHYTVRAENASFKTTEQKGIVLQLGDRLRVDFQLEVGSAKAVVTVEAEAASVAVQTDSNDISTVITGSQVTQLETNGRSLYELANLVPGASSAQVDFQTPTPIVGTRPSASTVSALRCSSYNRRRRGRRPWWFRRNRDAFDRRFV